MDDWWYENRERIESQVWSFIYEWLKADIYKAYLKNETYKYSIDAHLQMLHNCAGQFNAQLKQQEREKRYSNTSYRIKGKFDVYNDDGSGEDAILGFGDSGYFADKSYKGTSYKRMRYNITEFIKEYCDECETIYQQRIASYSRDFKPSNQIEILEMKKYMKESGNGTSNNYISNSQTQSSVNKFSSVEDLFIDYMRQYEVDCGRDNNGWLHFNYENSHFTCFVEEYEEGFSQIILVLPDIFAVGSNEAQDWKILNDLNCGLDVKFVIDNNKSINIIVSTWVDSTPEMDYLVPALINRLLDGQEEFNKRM